MAEKKIYPHANHRKRVRDAFRLTGADDMPDRSLLELILFYSVPRKDTNALAGELLKKYGSLRAVFDAPYEELMEIDGLGESSALLLTVIPGISRRYGGMHYSGTAIFEPGEAIEYIGGLFKDKEKEEFYIICLDALGRPVLCERLARGDTECVEVDKRAILETAFKADADSVILAHNHPFGEAAPSQNDTELTKEAARLLAETGIKLKDHIICGKDGSISLASTAKFKDLFQERNNE